MAAMHQPEEPNPVECANCGETQNLLKCSRCHTVWFCSVKCQKAYWPFHRPQCRRNEFADAVEEQEPKFAAWMRRHGKLAVLKDDEVDRLERATQAASGPRREEVMDSMYGRLEPKPLAPAYSAQELAAMRAAEEAGKAAARAALASTGGPAYATLELPAPGELSLDCQRYKWRQSQSHVEVFVPLPEGLTARRCSVQLSTSAISISVNDTRVLSGRLYRPIKAEESTWFVQDGVLEVTMLKRNRRGHYEAGTTNADTWWRAVVQGAMPYEQLALEHPPLCYYSAHCEELEKEKKRAPRLASGRDKQQQRSVAAEPPAALMAGA